MTPQVHHKQMKKVYTVLIGIVGSIVLVPFLLLLMIKLLIDPGGMPLLLLVIGGIFLLSIVIIAAYITLRKSTREDHPYNFIYAHPNGMMVERRVLNNDLPLKNFIPYQNIEYVSKEYKDHYKKIKSEEALGMNLSRRAKYVPKGALWIGLCPSEYKMLIKLRSDQEIGVPIYEAKTKTTRERIDLTDTVLISLRPEFQSKLLRVVKEGISSTEGKEDIAEKYKKRSLLKRNSIHDVVKTEFGSSLTKKDLLSKFFRSFFIIAAIVSIFVVIITPIIISTSNYRPSDPGELAAHILLTECMTLLFMIPIILVISLFSALSASNMKTIRKSNKVFVGRNYLEVKFTPFVKNTMIYINKFQRKDVVMVRPVKDDEIDSRVNKGWMMKYYGIENCTNISLHNLFVKRENLLLVKFNKEMKIYHSHLKKKWYRSKRGEMWTKKIIIDIPKERHDEFIDLVFS
jgi:hypothetical protein